MNSWHAEAWRWAWDCLTWREGRSLPTRSGEHCALRIADPLIGLSITFVILKITWDSWRTVRGGHTH